MQVRVETPDLTLGMYVAKLDRPWLDSPFLFQGFYIDSQETLRQLKATCQYVYVDTVESVVPVERLLNSFPSNPTVRTGETKPRVKFNLSRVSKDDVEQYSHFKQDLAIARKVNIETKNYISVVLEDVRLGKTIDTKSAKVIVNGIVDQIIKNPHAMVWFTNLKSRSEYTASHSLNVCIIALAFGSFCGLEREQLNVLGYGALFHDIGKMQVSLDILDKPSELTAREYEEVKQHPVYGYELLRNDNDFPADALDIVLSHHERNDGSGYPRGIKSGQIQFLSKIVSVVDMYDAITTNRIYHEPITPHEALSRMFQWVPSRFDQKIVEQFIKCLGIYPVGSLVELNTGEVGMVVSINDKHHLKPVILLLMNSRREFYNTRKLVNLANPELARVDNPPEIMHVLNAELEKIDIGRIIIDESLHNTVA